MKIIKKCPLLILLISTGILLTLAAAGGKRNIYKNLEYSPLKAPLLSLIFTGWNEEIYPWQMITENGLGKQTEDVMAEISPEENGQDKNAEEGTEGGNRTAAEDESGEAKETAAAPSPTPRPTPEPAPEASIAEGRLEPLRESTHEEYLNHISADIYGDAGVKRAAEYEFAAVDESYFEDALFIGDSRTVGLLDYTDLPEYADFYCETSLSIYKVMEENFKGKGTVPDALKKNDYGKIYLMVGINELGRGTTEDFMAKYTEVVDTLHEMEPEALIFIQGIMRVSGEKNSSDAIFNNSNINARNNAIATLADNQTIFYIDVNEVVCDEEGNLTADYTFDQIHLLGVYNDLWKQFLMTRGVVTE